MAGADITREDVEMFIVCLLGCLKKKGGTRESVGKCVWECIKGKLPFTDGELEALKMDLQAKGLLDQSD